MTHDQSFWSVSLMATWTVEVDEALIAEIERRDEFQIDQALAIQGVLRRGGPDALGVRAMDVEGVPEWELLG